MRFNVKEAHWLGERIKERILQAVKEMSFASNTFQDHAYYFLFSNLLPLCVLFENELNALLVHKLGEWVRLGTSSLKLFI
jgi:hypothetical protein